MWTYWCFHFTLLAKPWTFASGLSGHHSDGICCNYIICFSSRNSSRVLWEGLTLLEGTQGSAQCHASQHRPAIARFLGAEAGQWAALSVLDQQRDKLVQSCLHCQGGPCQ